MIKKLQCIFLSSFVSLIIIFLQNIPSLAWTVAPVRFEVKAEKGKEYTLTFSVLNESQLHEKRFEIQLDDWIIDKKNDFLRKAYNKGIENKYSATSWIKVTPMQFVIPPGQTKNVRFTVTVPNDAPLNGEYSTGIFVGEKNIEKPPKGEKIVHIKQDTFIGVVVYVRIGEGKSSVVLKDLKVDTKPIAKGLNKIILLPVYESHGNVHSRGTIQIKVEPISNSGVKVPKNVDGGEVVVLRETEVAFPVDIPVPLPANSEWKFVVNADFGGDTPILVGTKKYKVPFIEMPQEKNEPARQEQEKQGISEPEKEKQQETPAKKAEEKKV